MPCVSAPARMPCPRAATPHAASAAPGNPETRRRGAQTHDGPAAWRPAPPPAPSPPLSQPHVRTETTQTDLHCRPEAMRHCFTATTRARAERSRWRALLPAPSPHTEGQGVPRPFCEDHKNRTAARLYSTGLYFPSPPPPQDGFLPPDQAHEPRPQGRSCTPPCPRYSTHAARLGPLSRNLPDASRWTADTGTAGTAGRGKLRRPAQ